MVADTDFTEHAIEQLRGAGTEVVVSVRNSRGDRIDIGCAQTGEGPSKDYTFVGKAEKNEHAHIMMEKTARNIIDRRFPDVEMIPRERSLFA